MRINRICKRKSDYLQEFCEVNFAEANSRENPTIQGKLPDNLTKDFKGKERRRENEEKLNVQKKKSDKLKESKKSFGERNERC